MYLLILLVYTLIVSLNTTPTEEHVGTRRTYAKRGLTRIWGNISSQIVLLTFGMLLTIEQLHLLPWTASRMDWKDYDGSVVVICGQGPLRPSQSPSGEACGELSVSNELQFKKKCNKSNETSYLKQQWNITRWSLLSIWHAHLLSDNFLVDMYQHFLNKVERRAVSLRQVSTCLPWWRHAGNYSSGQMKLITSITH